MSVIDELAIKQAQAEELTEQLARSLRVVAEFPTAYDGDECAVRTWYTACYHDEKDIQFCRQQIKRCQKAMTAMPVETSGIPLHWYVADIASNGKRLQRLEAKRKCFIRFADGDVMQITHEQYKRIRGQV